MCKPFHLKLQLISGNFENIFNKMEKQREEKGDLFYALFEQKYEINATCQIRANRFISGRRMKQKKKGSITEQLLHTQP